MMTTQEAIIWVREFNRQKAEADLGDCRHFEDWTDEIQIDYSRRYFEHFNAPILMDLMAWCDNVTKGRG